MKTNYNQKKFSLKRKKSKKTNINKKSKKVGLTKKTKGGFFKRPDRMGHNYQQQLERNDLLSDNRSEMCAVCYTDYIENPDSNPPYQFINHHAESNTNNVHEEGDTIKLTKLSPCDHVFHYSCFNGYKKSKLEESIRMSFMGITQIVLNEILSKQHIIVGRTLYSLGIDINVSGIPKKGNYETRDIGCPICRVYIENELNIEFSPQSFPNDRLVWTFPEIDFNIYNKFNRSSPYGFNIPLYPGMISNNITTLILNNYNHQFYPGTFPESLKSLELRHYNNELVPGVFPERLQNLTLSSYNYKKLVPGIFPESIIWLDLTSYNHELDPNIFPKRMVVLNLNSYNHKKLVPGVFPHSLESLNLDLYNHRLDEGVLPENLKTLSLNSYNHQLDLRVFPNELRDLRLLSYEYELQSDGIPILPNKITDLHLSNYYNDLVKFRRLLNPTSFGHLVLKTFGIGRIKLFKKKYEENLILTMLDRLKNPTLTLENNNNE